MKKQRLLEVFLSIFMLVVSFTSTYAQAYECVGDRVIDPDHQMDEALVRDWDTESNNIDRLGVRVYLYIAATKEVVAGSYTGDLAYPLMESGVCGMNASDNGFSDVIMVNVAFGADHNPSNPNSKFAKTEILYGSDALIDRMEGYFLPGHKNNIMLELASGIESSIKEGTWERSLIPTLKEFNAALTTILVPQVAVQPTVQQQRTAMPTSPPISTSAPTEPSKTSSILFTVMIVLLVIVVMVILAIYWFANRRRIERIQAAQRAAQTAKNEAARLFNNWHGDEGKHFEVQTAIVLIGDIDKSEIVSLEAKLQEGSNLVSQAGEQITLVGRRQNMDPDLPLSEREYDDITDTYQDLCQLLQKAYAIAEELKREAEKLRQTVGAVAGQMAEAEEAIANAHQRIDLIQKQHFNIDGPVEVLQKAASQLSLAQTAMGNKRYSKASAAALESKRLSEEAATDAEALPAEKGRLEILLAELISQIATSQQIVSTAATMLDKLRGYAEASWTDVAGNPNEGENRIQWSIQNSQDMKLAIDEQSFDDAQSEYDQAVVWLQEAVALVEAIGARHDQIEEAAQKLPEALQEARRSIQAAIEMVARHDAYVSEAYEQQLAAASQQIEQLELAVKGEMPDYLTMLKQVHELDAQADNALNQAQEAAQIIARLKGRLEEVMKEAASSLGATQRYIENHQRDIGGSTLKMFEIAKEKLAKAGEARLAIQQDQLEEEALVTAYQQVTATALAADKAADDALSAAKKDVSETESARSSSYSYASPTYTSSPTVVIVDTSASQPTWGTSTTSRPNRTPTSSASAPSSRVTRASSAPTISHAVSRPTSSSAPRPSSRVTRAS